MNKRKPSIELMRFIAAVMVVLIHIREFVYPDNGLAELSFIVVDFFFMLTGFFTMCDASDSEKTDGVPEAQDAFRYSWKKAKGIFSLYIAAEIMMFFIHIAEKGSFRLAAVFKDLFHFKWEFMMLHMAGFVQAPAFNVDYLLPPAWFVSSMLLALVPFYFLARRFGKTFSGVIAPVCMMLIYSNIIQNYGTMNVGNEIVMGTMLANFRAFAGLSAGAFVYYLNGYFGKIPDTGTGRCFIQVMDAAAWIMVISLFVFPKDMLPEYDTVFWMFPFALILINGINNVGPVSRFLNTHGSALWIKLGRFSMYLYLLHLQIVVICRHLFVIENSIAGTFVIMIAAIAFSFLMMVIMEGIRSRCSRAASEGHQ